MYSIKEMKSSDKPRERLLEKGAYALSNEELLALLLSSGTKDVSVIELAKEVLKLIYSINELETINAYELMKIKGIKEAKATTILAAIELGKRIGKKIAAKKIKILSALDVYKLLHDEMYYLEQEHFITIYLDTKSYILKKETIFIGTINQTIIHPREIYKHAVKISASAVVFVHNHPTGDATPSKMDIRVTENLIKGGDILGIEVIDHIIIGKNECYSIKMNQKIKP